MTSSSVVVQRARVRVRGLVQGVGFRPFVYGLARRLDLSGWVLNDADGVLLEAQGYALEPFLRALADEAPPLARVDSVEPEALSPIDSSASSHEFVILESTHGGRANTGVTADAAVCRDCLEELFDPADRRYLYPFLNCTHCGPRHTITRQVPYDRPNTSMAAFRMCEACDREYHEPSDRRFHAQPVACPACGPKLSMPVAEIVTRLRAGQIVALKGLGGYHLVCDARSPSAVSELRRRKDRDGKPFAVMPLNVASAESLAWLDDIERSLLRGVQRPIVVVHARRDMGLAPLVAPDLDAIGLMLPYTPLHWLLFHESLGRPEGTAWLESPCDVAFVMTSGNPGGEPLVKDDDEAITRLSRIADAIVSHDRTIVVRSDDSVARVIDGAPRLLRRARGYAPEEVRLPFDAHGTLAVGAHQKNTVCLVRRDRAYVSQHLGDLDDVKTHTFFKETIDYLSRMLDVTPTLVAHDLHPDFLSTRWALASGLPTVAVQHHHAHVAAVLAEHRVVEPVVGVALDGFGVGTDGGAWGGELLFVDGGRCERAGHLRELALPGLDRAAREPWRMATAALHSMGLRDEAVARFGDRATRVSSMIDAGIACPKTSSAGRWFDAAAALLGIREVVSYEGEAPMILEGLVRSPRVIDDAFAIDAGVLDLLPLLRAVRSLDRADGADAFHGTLALAISTWVLRETRVRDLSTVVLTGGCFANRPLAEGVASRLRAAGIRPLLSRVLPCNDGGLSVGQAFIAALRTR